MALSTEILAVQWMAASIVNEPDIYGKSFIVQLERCTDPKNKLSVINEFISTSPAAAEVSNLHKSWHVHE